MRSFLLFLNWHEVSTVFTDDFVLSYVPYLLINNTLCERFVVINCQTRSTEVTSLVLPSLQTRRH